MSDRNFTERLKHLQMWWVTAEFVRRHPELSLKEVFLRGEEVGCLAVTSNEKKLDVAFSVSGTASLNSGFSWQPDNSGPDLPMSMNWVAERDLSDRRAVPKRLEMLTALNAPQETPPTTSQTLVFRVFYHLLLLALNEPADWEFRCAFSDPSGRSEGDAWSTRDFDDFPTARKAAAPRQDLDSYWAVVRDSQCVALVHADGVLHLSTAAPVSLMPLYDEADRDILAASLRVRQLITAQD